MRKDFRFGGSGGQGVISLAVLLANAYGVQNNYEVAQTQSYGPAARGGACKAELVVSDERIDYVKADKLDSFVAFNKPSFDKFKGDINSDTRLFVDSTFVTAEDVSGAKTLVTDDGQTIEARSGAFSVTVKGLQGTTLFAK